MSGYQTQIESLTSALRVVPPDQYRWFGELSPKPPDDIIPGTDQDTRHRLLVSQVQSRLYQHFYQSGIAVPGGDSIGHIAIAEESDFVRSLSDANRGRGTLQGGWAVVERSDSGIWACRNGLTVWVPTNSCRSERSLSESSNGTVAVFMPKEFLKRTPGFYLAQSDELFEPSMEDIVVRLYWHIAASGARLLIESVTSRLNADRVPFHIKIVNSLGAYRRNDAAVFYITKQDFFRASRLLSKVYDDVHHELQPGVPALTKQLAPGLALAEDPRNGESFGLHRCRLLAEAFAGAAQRGVDSSMELVQAVKNRFGTEGVDLAHPYLNPGSIDDYKGAFESLTPHRVMAGGAFASGQPASHAAVADKPAGAETYRNIAKVMGDRLVHDAIWHAGRCTWLGPRLSLSGGYDVGNQATYGVIGPDIYSGTAGIALFLAQLYAETGTEDYRATAHGAIKQAANQADHIFQQGRVGFYTGWTGIAASVARIGALLGDEALAHDVPSQLVERFHGDLTTPHMDLLSGAAGATVAFLSLWKLLKEEQYLADAIRCGDLLLSNAAYDGAAASWPVQTLSGWRELTGLAHGAAGIAFALLELYAATDEKRFRQAAECAFAFERRNFHPDLQNWLDLRYPVEGSRFGPSALTASVWCHGAGGIAVSRLTAWLVLADRAYLDEARVALRAASHWMEPGRTKSNNLWSLCHGLPGNADILLWTSQSLPELALSLERSTRAVADAGVALASIDSGTADLFGTDDPGLLLGHAGIGYFFLRLTNQDIPSVLVPAPVAFASFLDP